MLLKMSFCRILSYGSIVEQQPGPLLEREKSMANEEQLSILKQSVEVWNRWRSENRDAEVNLAGADLRAANLFRADLTGANFYLANLENAELRDAFLSGAKLDGARLIGAKLSGASLGSASLKWAKLMGAELILAKLIDANLEYADLRGAILVRTDFHRASLIEANLLEADLTGAELNESNLNRANLTKANLSSATIEHTNFGINDLREAVGLEKVIHHGPSIISTHTIQLSLGNIPDAFLRGCGLSDWEIEEAKLYNPDLSNEEINKILYKIYDLRASQALQISPLFISYSRADHELVNKIGDALTEKGVRYWRDIHEMKAGRMETQIDRAINQNRTVLLVLSEHSSKSDWVEHEVRTARELEKDTGRDVLCPVALDDSWKNSPWPKRVMEQVMEYNILDFSAWQDDSKFGDMFRKLIDGLELFYKG